MQETGTSSVSPRGASASYIALRTRKRPPHKTCIFIRTSAQQTPAEFRVGWRAVSAPMHDVIFAVPFPSRLVHAVKCLFRRVIDLDDFEHARNIAPGVEINHAAPQRIGCGIGERLSVAERTVMRFGLFEIAHADSPMMKAVGSARLQRLAKYRRLLVMLLDELNLHFAAVSQRETEMRLGRRAAIAAFWRHERTDQEPRTDVQKLAVPPHLLFDIGHRIAELNDAVVAGSETEIVHGYLR